MVGFEKESNELEKIGATVIAASVDVDDKAKLVADEVSFAVGQGVTKDIAEMVGAWWEPNRGIVQPAEFVIGADGKVVASSYSAGPLGRMDAADVIKLINFYESRK